MHTQNGTHLKLRLGWNIPTCGLPLSLIHHPSRAQGGDSQCSSKGFLYCCFPPWGSRIAFSLGCICQGRFKAVRFWVTDCGLESGGVIGRGVPLGTEVLLKCEEQCAQVWLKWALFSLSLFFIFPNHLGAQGRENRNWNWTFSILAWYQTARNSC